MVYVSTVYITKRIYNFMLKLPKIKILRFRDKYDYVHLITYNTKFFKHKLLLMGVNCKYYIPNIIFIL